MSRPVASDFHPEVLKLFDRFVHGLITRREFLAAATRYVVAGVSAEALLEALSPNFALARSEPEDPRISANYVEYSSPAGYGRLRGYLVQPVAGDSAADSQPTILVIHENRGLNPHIEDITRRLALENFIAFAPDALFPLGGYPGDEDKARELFPQLDQARTRADFIAAVKVLEKLPQGNGKVGVVGFCYGGGVASFLATRLPQLGAVVSFYGAPSAIEDVPKIKAPLLIHYAEHDERINAGWPQYEAALKKAGITYEAYIYPGVQHAFNNDTTPRYDAAAATLAWQRTVDFFNHHLRA
jgi:carboxymethylenebutenolidase